jgi:hypothetical protein
VLAIHGRGKARGWRSISRRRLEPGDVLLLQGSSADIHRLDPRDVLLLEDKSAHHPRTAKSRIALAVFAVCVLLAANALLPLSVAFCSAYRCWC